MSGGKTHFVAELFLSLCIFGCIETDTASTVLHRPLLKMDSFGTNLLGWLFRCSTFHSCFTERYQRRQCRAGTVSTVAGHRCSADPFSPTEDISQGVKPVVKTPGRHSWRNPRVSSPTGESEACRCRLIGGGGESSEIAVSYKWGWGVTGIQGRYEHRYEERSLVKWKKFKSLIAEMWE